MLKEITRDQAAFVSGGLLYGNLNLDIGIEQEFAFSYFTDMVASIDSLPGSPLLGIHALIPDRWENWYFGRTPAADGVGAWSREGGFWTYWDRNGNPVATYQETTKEQATSTITFNSGSVTFKASVSSVSGSIQNGTSSQTTYLRPLGQ